MINADYFKNKKIAIVGLARSGVACANLLGKAGAQISITEKQDNAVTRANFAKVELKNLKTELGAHTQDFIKGQDLIIVSPGVSSLSEPLVWAKEFNVPVISEIEAAFILCPAKVIAVTGSNGKTTVTTLIARILQASGKKAFACGNIGNPFCAEVERMREGDFVALEVSSFQLERIERFRPKVAVMLNFSRNHLDRHKDMQEYLEAKKRIFMNQEEGDFLVLNGQDDILKGLGAQARAKAIYFYETEGLNLNQAAVIAVGSALGISKQTCLKVFGDFKGIEHRMEYVGCVNEVQFINDSKSTTVEAAVWALKNINAPVIWIAGGRDKGNDYGRILELAKGKVRQMVIIGETRAKMKEAFGIFLPVSEASTLEEAVQIAYGTAKAGDCALLSPMCASFDMFTDYEDRGRRFKKAVRDLMSHHDTMLPRHQ